MGISDNKCDFTGEKYLISEPTKQELLREINRLDTAMVKATIEFEKHCHKYGVAMFFLGFFIGIAFAVLK